MAEAEAVPDPSEVAATFGLDLGAGQPSAPPAFDARAQLRERFEAQKAEYESMLAKAHALDGGDSMIALLTSKIADVSQSLDALGATAPVVAAVPAPVPAVLPEGAPMLPAPTGAGELVLSKYSASATALAAGHEVKRKHEDSKEDDESKGEEDDEAASKIPKTSEES